ncbi:hypothetical protein PO903_17865 [Paenibacillus sp. PK4536]|uniref:hypothetical protein n=1 Tax=Paenibacillus sp. PK4536 TaxID=3024576 RepID=UPI002358BC9C|nr:hypothetical protein [Paenibacillus sp. PK4536]WIM38498.1 hypothetical protein PO903_17865 [Paenibacillus sp. PK4536]
MLILVLHGVRAVLISFWFNETEINQYRDNNNIIYQKLTGNLRDSIGLIKQFYRKEKVISTFILIILLIVFLVLTIVFFNDSWRHSVSIIIVIFAYLLLTTVYSLNYQFYKRLSEYRAKKEKIKSRFKLSEFCEKSESEKLPKEEFIESYKHLREHGNAFGIIICEILFAFWLVFWEFSFWAVFYWSLIGFSSWILGTYLEVKIVSEYKKQ